jgi:hypothetical protein
LLALKKAGNDHQRLPASDMPNGKRRHEVLLSIADVHSSTRSGNNSCVDKSAP